MEDLRSMLESVGHDLEPQVRSQLAGFFGGMVRAYLPQTWVFKTELATAFLTVNRSGSVTVGEGMPASPDVTIETAHARLVVAFQTRSRQKVPPGSLRVTAHTSKGKTAFDYLRGRLGL